MVESGYMDPIDKPAQSDSHSADGSAAPHLTSTGCKTFGIRNTGQKKKII